MNNVINFILESGVSLSLFSLIYVLFLRKETFFRMNRYFLLISVAFSVVLPFLTFRIYEPHSIMLSEVTVTPYRNLLEVITVYGKDITLGVENFILSANLIIYIYLLGLIFFIGRFIFRLAQIMLILKRNPVEKLNGARMVILDNNFSPFSFLDFVFISKNQKDQQGYHRMVAHELEHVKQGHTFDVLILELLTAIQWFNPFIWMLKKAIRENHEFLADQAVLKEGINHASYKQLLLSQFIGEPILLANSFNSSLIKNRIKMISKIKSSKIANIKFIAGVVIAAALIIVFACDKKESANANKTNLQSQLSISFDNESLKITGAEEDVNKVKELLSSGNFEIINDPDVIGQLMINKKSKVTDEIVAVAYGKEVEEDSQVYFIVEDMPEFPGGEMALRKFIARTVKYPKKAQEKGIQGKVYVSFVVGKDGYVRDARIARGVDPSLDQEALRVMSNLPKWKPGYQNGKPVNISHTVPINFVLQ